MPIHMPTWSQTKTTGKAGFDKVYTAVDKLGAPINRLSNKVGAEAFWPTTLDKESDKAARILKSFCKDGFYVEQPDDAANGHPDDGKPRGKQRVLKKIPSSVIRNAKGLAIFTTMRTGLWVSGAGGSGILIARKADGSWSPPSGILLHTAGLGFLIGVDIYDCVVVINTAQALEAFTKIRCTLGGEVSATAGPVGMGGLLESEIHKRQAPVWNYLKSRGFYAGVQVDGTVIIQRQDENERFYGEKREVDQILRGEVRHVPPETKTLLATIQMAQGDEVDPAALPGSAPTPGDLEVQLDDNKRFGLPPSEDDPDPFGVKALQEEGMVIKEITNSGEKNRPSLEAFEYKPAPSSPIFNQYRESMYKRHSKRASHDSGRFSVSSVDRGTQTDGAALESPRILDSPRESGQQSPIKKMTEDLSEDVEEDAGEHDDDNDDDDDSLHEETVTVEAPVVIERAKVVTIPRRIPPPLPARNPHRSGQFTSPTGTTEYPTSPLAQEAFGISGLGISDAATSTSNSPKRTNPEKGVKDEQPDENMHDIHLTTSQNEALAEELSHIHLSPREQRHRPTSSRQETSSSDVHPAINDETASVMSLGSNYSGLNSPPELTPFTSRIHPPENDFEAASQKASADDAPSVPPASETVLSASHDDPHTAPNHNTDVSLAEAAPSIVHTKASPETGPVTERGLHEAEHAADHEVKDPEKEKDRDLDEFHSIPGTPMETTIPAEASIHQTSIKPTADSRVSSETTPRGTRPREETLAEDFS